MVNQNRITRLVRYRNALRDMKTAGYLQTYSSDLGTAVGEKSSQIRKDFSLFGITGTKRDGYNISALLDAINKILFKQKPIKAIIAGYGRLGRALIDYKRFKDENIHIKAVFEINKDKWDPESPIPILPVSQMESFIAENEIKIGIISAPQDAAKQVFKQMLAGGIKGVMNFAPVHLDAPEGFPLNNINLAIEIEVLSFLTEN